VIHGLSHAVLRHPRRLAHHAAAIEDERRMARLPRRPLRDILSIDRILSTLGKARNDATFSGLIV